jgi:DNA-binding response OmpR family regulator
MSEERRILLIDTNPSFRESLARLLVERGFDVPCAATGQRGIDILKREGADLVLLDDELKDMNSLEACRVLKDSASETFLPVVFLTSRADSRTRVRLIMEGGDDVCVKPLKIEELTERLEAFLRHRDHHGHVERRGGWIGRSLLGLV